MKQRIRSIVAATDFSENAGWAVERAVRLALAHRAKLELFHVVSETALRSLREWLGPGEGADFAANAGDKLDELRARIAVETGLEAGVTVVEGNIVGEIIAASVDADLVVLGARGAHRLRDQVVGTTADRFLGKSGAHMLVVKSKPNDAYRTVLVPVDFSAVSARAVQASVDWTPGAEILVYNVCQEPFESMMYYASVKEHVIDQYRTKAVQRALMDMEGFVQNLVARPSNLKVEVHYGHPAAMILQRANDLEADLLVIGKHGRSTLEAFFMGSVTRHVLPDAKADVLIVPG